MRSHVPIYPDILALKHESRKFRYCRDGRKSRIQSLAHFQASLVKPRQAGAQTVRNKKQAVKTFDTTQKYLIFLLSCFRTRMSAVLSSPNPNSLLYTQDINIKIRIGYFVWVLCSVLPRRFDCTVCFRRRFSRWKNIFTPSCKNMRWDRNRGREGGTDERNIVLAAGSISQVTQ